DLVESHAERLALFPTIYFVVDPDMRRFPLPPARGTGTREAIEPFQLVKNLVATARSASLAQAATLARWQLDTRILLDRTSVLFGDFAGLQDEALRIVGNEGAGAPTGLRKDAFHGQSRRGLARFLFACARDETRLHACAEQLRGSSPLSPEEHTPVPVPGEILAFARQVEDSLKATDEAVTAASKESLEQRLSRLAYLVDAVFVYAADLRFLQGELERLRVQLDASELDAFREQLLDVIGRSRLMAQTQRILLSSVAAAIVREEPVPGSEEQTLVDQLVSRLDTPLDATLAQAGTDGSRLAAVRALSRRLDSLADRAEELSSAAAQLGGGRTGERRLVVPSRFLPLSASSLLGFGGFLDPTLREVDFNVGVYEMATQLAEFRCSIRDPYDASASAAALRSDAPWELDFREPASAECLGQELEHVAVALELRRSVHALAFFSAATQAHLAALMGSRAAAAAALRKPAWAWLEKAAAAHPRDDVEVALGVLTSRPAPCHAGDPDALCFEDPGYSALVAGL
ncbi:MAG TPA: hypothetical protein VH208_11725, partial [Myxococcaceae bacterium]|nr:hypothetical protein [Myxococcaceae bacterium]